MGRNSQRTVKGEWDVARFDRDDAVEALAAVGTQFVSIDADDVPAELLAAVLA